MTRSEVIAKLQKEGFAATAGRIRQALRNGFVRPLPKQAARGAHDFSPRHLAQLRRYFVNVRLGPRPQWVEKIPITSAADRVHRLAREKQRLRERGPPATVLRRQRRREADAAIGVLERNAGELAHERFPDAIPASSRKGEQ